MRGADPIHAAVECDILAATHVHGGKREPWRACIQQVEVHQPPQRVFQRP